ncbi:MAG: hypothetical protein AAGD05_10060 [Bacteroidota bacterium]
MLAVSLLLTWNVHTTAQSITDAINYGTFNVGGTARTIGIGGAISALGGDFAVLSTNPAGLAVYRKSEVVFSPGLNLSQTTGQLLTGNNPAFDENKTYFNFNNLGLVFSSKGNNWKTSNFGIGFNRLADFREELNYEGNSPGSIVNWFVEIATDGNGVSIAPQNLNPYGAGLAFQAEAFFDGTSDPNDDDYFWTTDFDLAPDAEITRSEQISRKGSINEVVLSWAGNYRNRLMIGVTLGVPFLRDTKERIYREEDPVAGPEGNVPFFNNLTYTESLETSGTGINLKLGMIYRVSQLLRLGAAVHTPTRFALTDEFNNSLAYTFTLDGDIIGNFAEPGAPRNFEYNVVTPWRFLGSAAAIIRKHGFVSAEIEWVNYAGTNFNLTRNSQNIAADQAFEDVLNADIENLYQSALNIRFGGEYAYQKFRARAGFAMTGNSLADGD